MGALAVNDRILTTREMAQAFGFCDTDWVSVLCRKGKIPGAWRVTNEGKWRIQASKFREHLLAQGIPTDRLDALLKSSQEKSL